MLALKHFPALRVEQVQRAGLPRAADDIGVCGDGGRHRRRPVPLHRAPHDLRRRRHRPQVVGRGRRRVGRLLPHLHAAALWTCRVSECSVKLNIRLWSPYPPCTGWSIWSDNWVDFDLGRSTICLLLLGLMGSWQNWLRSWAKWWNFIDQSQPNPTIRADGPPCSAYWIALVGNEWLICHANKFPRHPSRRFPSGSCNVDWGQNPGYSSVYLVSAVFLPICVVIVCYSLILQVNAEKSLKSALICKTQTKDGRVNG